MTIIAIIPARIGSKRIPKKNIKEFAGKPIISYSIEAAEKSGLFDRIIVSTDSEEITDVAKKYGADVPFMRPDELATDAANNIQVLLHALSKLPTPEYFCCIYATAPLIKAENIKKGLKILKEKNATTVFPITTFSYPIFRAVKIDRNNMIEMMWPGYIKVKSQHLPKAYHDAAQFYWVNTKKFMKEQRLISNRSFPLIISRHETCDIDTEEDWKMAEIQFKIKSWENYL